MTAMLREIKSVKKQIWKVPKKRQQVNKLQIKRPVFKSLASF